MYNMGEIVTYEKRVGYIIGYYEGKYIVRDIIEKRNKKVAKEEIIERIGQVRRH